MTCKKVAGERARPTWTITLLFWRDHRGYRSSTGMSYQVRHFQPSSSRFRSCGFNSASPPSSSSSSVEEPTATTILVRQQSDTTWMSTKPNVELPSNKKRRTCPIAAAFLDPALWRFLPDDLLEKVAAYMPFPGLFRCRAVNKRLKEFVFSEKFQEARACVKSWDSLYPKSQYLLIFATIKGENLCTAYDAVANRWLRMPPMRGLDPRAKDCIAGALAIPRISGSCPIFFPCFHVPSLVLLSSTPPSSGALSV